MMRCIHVNQRTLQRRLIFNVKAEKRKSLRSIVRPSLKMDPQFRGPLGRHPREALPWRRGKLLAVEVGPHLGRARNHFAQFVIAEVLAQVAHIVASREPFQLAARPSPSPETGAARFRRTRENLMHQSVDSSFALGRCHPAATPPFEQAVKILRRLVTSCKNASRARIRMIASSEG